MIEVGTCIFQACISFVSGRNLHADVLEWIWFLNAHNDVIYKLMHGDKDTFRLAFELAGKGDAFIQVIPAHVWQS